MIILKVVMVFKIFVESVLHEEEMMELCSPLGFDSNEVHEAIEHLVTSNQIMHLGEGLYGFAD